MRNYLWSAVQTLTRVIFNYSLCKFLVSRDRAIYCVIVQNEGDEARMISPSTSSTVPDVMPMIPMTRSWEVSEDKVKIVKVIGKGAFGQVAKATVENLHNMKGITAVAVKMLKGKVLLLISELLKPRLKFYLLRKVKTVNPSDSSNYNNNEKLATNTTNTVH